MRTSIPPWRSTTRVPTPVGVGRLPRIRIFSIVSVLLTIALAVHANSTAIDTNRPGFSFSPNVVDAGTWQIETALGYGRSDGGLESFTLPQLELRYGAGDIWEVFVSGVSWNKVDSAGSRADGFGDVAIGAKLAIGNPDSEARVALLLLFSAPTGARDFSSDRWDPSVGLVWSGGGKFPFAGTAKISNVDGGLVFGNGLKLPMQLTERQSVFLEWEANIPASGRSSHWLNTGFQWLLSKDVQLDAGADLSLSESGDEYRLGVGFSTRF